MQTKRVSLIDVKADGAGTFTALASVFGNEDRQGDRVVKGAFKNTIRRMKEAGKVLPIVSSHNHDDPRFTIGTAKADDLTETDKGLEVKGQLDLDNPIAAQVHRLFKSGAWTGWSFGYQVLNEKTGKDGVNELTELDLLEAGPCLAGANPEAQLLEAKSAVAQVQRPLEAPELSEEQKAQFEEVWKTWSDRHVVQEETPPEESSAAEEEVAVKKEVENAKPRDPLKDKLVAGHLDDLSH